MAQGPFLIDQVQIEPGSVGSRLITRDAGTGGLKFTDPFGSMLLSQMAGLRNIANVLIVGKSGLGAQYTTIQAALDVVPANASATNPYIVLVLPGRYDETVTINRDGVRLVGLGQPEIRSALEAVPNAPGATHTLNILAGLGSTPRSILVEGFVISNAHNGQAVVRVTGAAGSVLGDGNIVLRNCSLRANAAGGNYSLSANACNNIIIEGGAWSEANNLGLFLIREVSLLRVTGVEGLGALDLRYDTSEDEPANGPDSYIFSFCRNVASSTALMTPITSTCTGGGRVEFEACSLNFSTFAGDQTLEAKNTLLTSLTLQGTTSAQLFNSTRANTNVNALAVLDEHRKSGEVVFAASTDEAVTFDIPYSDGNYHVSFEVDSRPDNDETPWITGKVGAGFTVRFQSAQNLTVTWVATRLDR